LSRISDALNIDDSVFSLDIPPIPYSEDELLRFRGSCILILGNTRTKTGQPLSINSMRDSFGIDPHQSEPCFYNQDWYLREPFANQCTIEYRWYIFEKEVRPESRGKEPSFDPAIVSALPSALLLCYTFFAYHILNGVTLWQHDYLWCSDMDSFGDRIYVGRYYDPNQLNKNGFSIHRHLTIKQNYGSITILPNSN